jgi:porin
LQDFGDGVKSDDRKQARIRLFCQVRCFRLRAIVGSCRNAQVSLAMASMLGVVSLSAQKTPSPVPPVKLPNTAPPQPPRNQKPESWLNQPTITGDWGGERSKLQDSGILLRAHFLTESAANPVGGQAQAARYTQQIDFGVDFDLGRLINVNGGKIQVTFTDRAGRNLSADAIGNQFSVQELFGAGQNFRLAELNYQQNLLGNRITFGVGWSPVGDEFATIPILCAFQNVVLCGHANAVAINSGAQNFPVGQWGAHVTVRPNQPFYVATGIYRVNPQAANGNNGFDLSFRGTGIFVPVEFGWLPATKGGLPGTYKLGTYYNSSPTPNVLTDVNGTSAGLTGGPFATNNGRWGAYAMADQTIYRPSSSTDRGLRIGGLAGMGDRQTSQYSYFLASGGLYQGAFRSRENDFVSFSAAYVRTNPRLTTFQQDRKIVAPGSIGIQTYESIAEIDYNFQIAPWLSLRPNVQYIINPGGAGKLSNAFVVGLYTGVTF